MFPDEIPSGPVGGNGFAGALNTGAGGVARASGCAAEDGEVWELLLDPNIQPMKAIPWTMAMIVITTMPAVFVGFVRLSGAAGLYNASAV